MLIVGAEKEHAYKEGLVAHWTQIKKKIKVKIKTT